MKNLMIALSLLFVATVQAGEIKIVSISQYELWGSAYVTQEFAVNPELGRAWVEVSVSSNDPEGGLGSTEKYKVAGLSFDDQTKSVMLDFEGKLTTCAVLKTTGRGIFRQTVIKQTPACKFVGRWRDISYDDGFEIKKTSRYEVFLIVE